MMTRGHWRQLVLASLAWSMAFWSPLADGLYDWRVMLLIFTCVWVGLLALMALALLCARLTGGGGASAMVCPKETP
jgi:hypothetical protein